MACPRVAKVSNSKEHAMTGTLKALSALPLIALLAACVGGGAQVETQSEIEATLDEDIDNDGSIPDGGIEVGDTSE
jgi:hypothetical protein